MMSENSSDWRPTAALEILQLRARILARIREFFCARDVLEVETPCLSACATTDPALTSLRTEYRGPLFPQGRAFYLHTSPEFAMKRFLAAGSNSIYQICKVFRDGEAGRLHNPEFTLLEWYRVGLGYHAMMDETAALLTNVCAGFRAFADPEKISYRELFERYCHIQPHTASIAELAEVAKRHGIPANLQQSSLVLRDLLMTHVIEPHLGQGRLTIVYDYPAAQAALARLDPANPSIAERFEIYLDGVELANGFHELQDAVEQRARFEQDSRRREQNGQMKVPQDERFLAALEAGLPDCSGVALGLDRLVMLAAGLKSIQQVIGFPIERA